MAEFFVRRPIVAMVIAIIIVLLGVVSLKGLPVAQYPDITPPEVGVTAIYTGANAEVVEQSVATPLEQKVNGVENMLYMKSVNSNDGSMNLTVSFEVGSDLDMSNVQVQNRVSEAQSSIPEEVKRLGITVKKKLSFPLLLVTLYSPNNSYDQDFQSNYLTINILDAVARIQGVGQASVLGGSEYAMRVWVKPDQLAKLGLTAWNWRNKSSKSWMRCRLIFRMTWNTRFRWIPPWPSPKASTKSWSRCSRPWCWPSVSWWMMPFR